jgi:hypothetical protein
LQALKFHPEGLVGLCVLREVQMSRREEEAFSFVTGLAVVGALVIAAVMALA